MPCQVPVYVQVFERCNFQSFHGQLAFHKIFIEKFHDNTLAFMCVTD